MLKKKLFLLFSVCFVNLECLPVKFERTASQNLASELPRCGVSSESKLKRAKRFAAIQGWQKRHLTYHISNWSPRLSEEIVARNMQKALDVWGRHGNLTFSRSPSPSADINVSFLSGDHGDGQPFDGTGLVLAHAFYPGDTHFPGSSGDIHFDNDELWADFTNLDRNRENGKDFFAVALHEIGHSLGLSHSDVEGAVMYKLYKDDEQKDLDYDDVMGIRTLYVNRILNEDKPSTEAPVVVRAARHHQKKSRVKKLFQNRNNPITREPKDPNICRGHFDTIGIIREEVFLFRNDYLWRLDSELRLYPGYPVKIHQNFPYFPETIRKMDAVYQRPNGDIIFISGKQLWIYNGNRVVENSPRPLNYFDGLEVDGIDAIYNSETKGKTYIFKNNQFWIYDENTKKLDPGYPKFINSLGPIPGYLDAVFTWTDGITYFVKGDFVWMLENDKNMEMKPLPMPSEWLGCKNTNKPVYSTRKPAYNTKKPVYSTKKPVYNTHKPVQNRRKPVYKTHKPVHNRKKPVFKTQKPFKTSGSAKVSLQKSTIFTFMFTVIFVQCFV